MKTQITTDGRNNKNESQLEKKKEYPDLETRRCWCYNNRLLYTLPNYHIPAIFNLKKNRKMINLLPKIEGIVNKTGECEGRNKSIN